MHDPDLHPGRLRPGVDLLPPPLGADGIDARRVDRRRAPGRPVPGGEHRGRPRREVLLLAQEGPFGALVRRPPPSPAGDPREVLQATAAAHLDACHDAEQRWFAVAGLLSAAGLPGRLAGPCWDAAPGVPLTNTSYRAAAAVVRRRSVSEQQASRDLRAVVDAGFVRPQGRTPDRTYGSNRT